jgi:multicomponent Na+:H+ antiporter subunit G
MTAETLRDVVAGVLLVGGALLAFGAGAGIVRFPDLLARMHAATKPQVLGLVLVLLGLAVRLGGVPVVWMLLLVVMFQLLTSPVAAHMVARAGYRTGKVAPDALEVDELTRDLRAAERALAERGDAAADASAELRDVADDALDRDADDAADAADDDEVSGG